MPEMLARLLGTSSPPAAAPQPAPATSAPAPAPQPPAPAQAPGATSTGSKVKKVVLVGDPQVGKTGLSCALTKRPFPQKFIWLDQQLDGESVRLCIYDCGFVRKSQFGGPDAALTLKGYFKNAHIALLVYDVTLADSFEGVKHWHNQIKSSPEECPNCKFLIVGTRSDVTHHQEVHEYEVENYAREHNLKHLRVSAKTQSGIDVLLTAITRSALEALGTNREQEVSTQGSIGGLVPRSSNGPNSSTTSPGTTSSNGGGAPGGESGIRATAGYGGSSSSTSMGGPLPTTGMLKKQAVAAPTYRIAVLGGEGAGKTTFLHRITGRPLSGYLPHTTTVIQHEKKLGAPGNPPFLLLTPGEKSNPSVTPQECSIIFSEGAGHESQVEPSGRMFKEIITGADAVIFVAHDVDSLKRLWDFQTRLVGEFGFMKAPSLPTVLISNVKHGQGIARSTLEKAAENMGVLCAEMNMVQERLDTLDELAKVLATLIWRWKADPSKAGKYDANLTAFGNIVTGSLSLTKLKFRKSNLEFLNEYQMGAGASHPSYGGGQQVAPSIMGINNLSGSVNLMGSTAGNGIGGYGAFSGAPGLRSPQRSALGSKKPSMEDSGSATEARSTSKPKPSGLDTSGTFTGSTPSKPARVPPRPSNTGPPHTETSDSHAVPIAGAPQAARPGEKSAPLSEQTIYQPSAMVRSPPMGNPSNLDRTMPSYSSASKPKAPRGPPLSSSVVDDVTSHERKEEIVFEVQKAPDPVPPQQQTRPSYGFGGFNFGIQGVYTQSSFQQQQLHQPGGYAAAPSSGSQNLNRTINNSVGASSNLTSNNPAAVQTQPNFPRLGGTTFQAANPSLGFSPPMRHTPMGFAGFGRTGALSPGGRPSALSPAVMRPAPARVGGQQPAQFSLSFFSPAMGRG